MAHEYWTVTQHHPEHMLLALCMGYCATPITAWAHCRMYQVDGLSRPWKPLHRTMLAVAELVLVHVCSYEVVLKNGDTKGQLMSLQQTLRQEIHAKIGAQTAEESAKRKVCPRSLSPAALQHLHCPSSHVACSQTDTSPPLVHALMYPGNQCMSSF